MTRLRRWVAYQMRRWADRIDLEGAPKRLGYSFTFERGVGIKFRDDHRGCPLWRYGDDGYDRAWTEADLQ